MAANKNLTIQQGKTFSLVLRWEAPPIVYKAITAAQQSAPLRLTVPGHGVPDGWRVVLTGMKGMTEANAVANDVKTKDYHAVTVVDANTVELNEIDASGFRAYTSGGHMQYNSPVDLAGFTARMTVKDKIGGNTLLSLTTANGGIAIDNTARTITLLVSATDTAALTWKKGVYDLELVSAGGVVTALIAGTVTVTQEVTT